MWLVDENLPPKLYAVFAEFGITAQSASYAGLAGLTNGVLTKKAIDLGFSVIVTQDKTFVDDAAAVLKLNPKFAVIVLVLPQVPASSFLERFRSDWTKQPIVPVEGKVVVWPK